MAYPGIQPEHGVVAGARSRSAWAAAVVGALVGAGVVASKKMAAADEADGKE